MADIASGAGETTATPGSSTSATPKTSSSRPTGERVVSRGGSDISFDDLEQAENAETRAKREKANERRREQRAAGKEAEEPSTHSDESRDRDRAPKAQSSEKDTKDKPEKERAPKKEEQRADDQEKEVEGDKAPKPKSKAFKFRQGDSELEVAGDAVVQIPVNGKMEEYTLQDLANEFSGKTDYSRKYSEFGVEKGRFIKERDELESTLNQFFEKSQKDPDAAWDFLAEMNGHDPIEFKTKLLMQQVEALRHVALMDEDSQKAWLAQQQLNWREKRVKAAESATAEKQQREAATVARKETMDRFQIDEKGWDEAYKVARGWNKGQFPRPDQVAAVSRYIMADRAAKEVVPHLLKHPKYGNIVEDLVHDLMKNPEIGVDTVKRLLVENFGDDDAKKSLKAVAAKVTREAQRDGSSAGRAQQKKNDDVWSFDQL
jgi:hypothetical protein